MRIEKCKAAVVNGILLFIDWAEILQNHLLRNTVPAQKKFQYERTKTNLNIRFFYFRPTKNRSKDTYNFVKKRCLAAEKRHKNICHLALLSL